MISKSSIDKAEVENRFMHGRRIISAMSPLVKGKNLRAVCARGLHDGVLVPALKFGYETFVFVNIGTK